MFANDVVERLADGRQLDGDRLIICQSNALVAVLESR